MFFYYRTQDNLTALGASVKNGYCRIVSLLLKHGADPNETICLNVRNDHVIYCLQLNYNDRCIILVIQSLPWSPLNLTSSISHLEVALREGYVAIVKLLLRAGAKQTNLILNRNVKLDTKTAFLLCYINGSDSLLVSLLYYVVYIIKFLYFIFFLYFVSFTIEKVGISWCP